MMVNVMSWRLPHPSVFCDCDARLIVCECKYACFHTLTQCLFKGMQDWECSEVEYSLLADIL